MDLQDILHYYPTTFPSKYNIVVTVADCVKDLITRTPAKFFLKLLRPATPKW